MKVSYIKSVEAKLDFVCGFHTQEPHRVLESAFQPSPPICA